MKREEFKRFLEFIGIEIDEFCDILGYGTERCPNIDLALCDGLDCFPNGNKHCWKKYFDENLES